MQSCLANVDLFKGLSESCLNELEANSEVRDFRSGHYLFRTAEAGEALFILEAGAVQTFRTSGTKTLIIAELKPPQLFGEMGCVGQRLCHCSAQTTEPSRIRIISRRVLDAVLEQHPSVTRRLLDLVSQRFVNVLMDLDATSFRQLIPRLAKLLLERADEDLIRDMSHKDMAQHLRVYRESATAALGELKRAGIIEVGRKQIRILDKPRLERAARE
ncbi:MAG TPA: Crp/Fnr family transcriptional regulator [Terriglobales bacterium]|nr:Crp/Fnr family transcriptional regulator [Terriglobales bacterium]